MTIARFADVVSVVSLGTGFLVFPSAVETYRGPIILSLTLAGLWLFYSFYGRYRAMIELKRKEVSEPRVLLLGGEQSKSVMSTIARSPLVERGQYVQFIDVVVPDVRLREKLAAADALILMHDFTHTLHADTYDSVTGWFKTLPVPVARYYPADFRETKVTDFHTIPFDTPAGIVEFAAEFLLKRAVDRGRYVDSRYRLSRRINWVAAALIAVGTVWALQTFKQLHILERALMIVPTIQQELADNVARFRDSLGPISPATEASVRNLLQGWAKIQVDQINRISKTDDDKRLYIYSLSADKTHLIPVISYGAEGYPLDAKNSIAGCAMWNRFVVHWTGDRDQTKSISAWRLSGEAVGQYDEHLQALTFPEGTCKFDNEGWNDPKGNLLCVPVGVDDSKTSPLVPGVVCISSADPGSSFLFGQRWLRSYLVAASFPLGLVDLSALASHPLQKKSG
jgi:hypothetical protein